MSLVTRTRPATGRPHDVCLETTLMLLIGADTSDLWPIPAVSLDTSRIPLVTSPSAGIGAGSLVTTPSGWAMTAPPRAPTRTADRGQQRGMLGSRIADHATPNLPSRSFAATIAFYERLEFSVVFQDADWLILHRGGLVLEFFPYPDLDPATSSFGCCLRLEDADAFHAECQAADIPESTLGWPRIHRPRLEASGMRIGALIDPDGSLLRLVQNPE